MLQQRDPLNQRDQRSALTRSVENAMTVAAAAISVLGGMAVFDLTKEFVQGLAIQVYGTGGLTAVILMGWGVCCYLLVFWIARATLLAFWLVLAAVIFRYGIGFAV